MNASQRGKKMITATIQARMGSSRLPGKVLADIEGKPLLLWQIERIKRSRLVDNIIVATSDSKKDDELQHFCSEYGVQCYRGPEDDVLARVSSLLKDLRIETHVECYGDSPLIDPQIIDEFVGYFLKHKQTVDYVSSAIKTTYPPGLEVTVYAAETLIEVNKWVSNTDPLREHVGYNVTRFPDSFKIMVMEAPNYFYAPDLYLEVDTPNDLSVIQSIFKYFNSLGKHHFSLSDILNFLQKNPNITKKNASEDRRWKKFRDFK